MLEIPRDHRDFSLGVKEGRIRLLPQSPATTTDHYQGREPGRFPSDSSHVSLFATNSARTHSLPEVFKLNPFRPPAHAGFPALRNSTRNQNAETRGPRVAHQEDWRKLARVWARAGRGLVRDEGAAPRWAGRGRGAGPRGGPEAGSGRGCERGAGLRVRGRSPNRAETRSCLKRSLCGALAGVKEGR